MFICSCYYTFQQCSNVSYCLAMAVFLFLTKDYKADLKEIINDKGAKNPGKEIEEKEIAAQLNLQSAVTSSAVAVATTRVEMTSLHINPKGKSRRVNGMLRLQLQTLRQLPYSAGSKLRVVQNVHNFQLS